MRNGTAPMAVGAMNQTRALRLARTGHMGVREARIPRTDNPVEWSVSRPLLYRQGENAVRNLHQEWRRERCDYEDPPKKAPYAETEGQGAFSEALMSDELTTSRFQVFFIISSLLSLLSITKSVYVLFLSPSLSFPRNLQPPVYSTSITSAA